MTVLMKWTAREIARRLYWDTFAAKHMVIVPNCYAAGAESDLLIVRRDLRLMDVEIKISRSDLKADQHKDKWRKPWDYQAHGWYRQRPEDRERVDWPANIWKHYFAVPHEIWSDALFTEISPASGVIAITDRGHGSSEPSLRMLRKARPNKEAKPITTDELAKLAVNMNIRMWKAYGEVDEHRRAHGAPVREYA